MNKLTNYLNTPLTRDQAKQILGGLRDVNDDCPAGTHEFNCVTGGTGLDNLTYIKYCVQDGQPNPACQPPV